MGGRGRQRRSFLFPVKHMDALTSLLEWAQWAGPKKKRQDPPHHPTPAMGPVQARSDAAGPLPGWGSRANGHQAPLPNKGGACGSGPPRAAPGPYLLPAGLASPGWGGAPHNAEAPGQRALGRHWGPGRSREALRPALPQARRHERAGHRPPSPRPPPPARPPRARAPLPLPLSPPTRSAARALSAEPRRSRPHFSQLFRCRSPPHPCAQRPRLPSWGPDSLGGGGVADLAGPGAAAPSLQASAELRLPPAPDWLGSLLSSPFRPPARPLPPSFLLRPPSPAEPRPSPARESKAASGAGTGRLGVGLRPGDDREEEKEQRGPGLCAGQPRPAPAPRPPPLSGLWDPSPRWSAPRPRPL